MNKMKKKIKEIKSNNDFVLEKIITCCIFSYKEFKEGNVDYLTIKIDNSWEKLLPYGNNHKDYLTSAMDKDFLKDYKNYSHGYCLECTTKIMYDMADKEKKIEKTKKNEKIYKV